MLYSMVSLRMTLSNFANYLVKRSTRDLTATAELLVLAQYTASETPSSQMDKRPPDRRPSWANPALRKKYHTLGRVSVLCSLIRRRQCTTGVMSHVMSHVRLSARATTIVDNCWEMFQKTAE